MGLLGLGGVMNAVVEVMNYYKRKATRKRAIEEFERQYQVGDDLNQVWIDENAPIDKGLH